MFKFEPILLFYFRLVFNVNFNADCEYLNICLLLRFVLLTPILHIFCRDGTIVNTNYNYVRNMPHNDIDVSCHSQFSIGSFVVRGRYFKAEERRYDAMLLKFEADGKPLLVAVAGDDNMWRGYEEEVEVSSPEL